MNEEFQIDVTNIDNSIYYILPLSDCSSCQGTSLNLKLLASASLQSNPTTIIIVGQTNIADYKNLIETLRTKFNILEDKDNTIFSYQTGLSKPMLLHINKGVVKHYMSITDFKINEAGEYLIANS